jgi:hypothetical protein
VTGAGPANYFGAINRKSIEANDKKHFMWVWKTEKKHFFVFSMLLSILTKVGTIFYRKKEHMYAYFRKCSDGLRKKGLLAVLV